MKKLLNHAWRSICALILTSSIYAADVSVWPFSAETKAHEFTVIYIGDVSKTVGRSITPDDVKNDCRFSLTVRGLRRADPLVKKFYEFIAEATPIPAPKVDYRWGITLTTSAGASQQFFVAYEGKEVVAKLGKEYFKLDASKTRAFL